jgi:hypothetical protein
VSSSELPGGRVKKPSSRSGNKSTVKSNVVLSRHDRALEETRRILITQAKRGEPITYLDLTKRIKSMKLIPNSYFLSKLLCSISMKEYSEGRGLLSAVVVHKHGNRLGIPGEGFFKLAPMIRYTEEEWPDAWRREVEKVFRHWRKSHRSSR